jgi:hypothetical protein
VNATATETEVCADLESAPLAEPVRVTAETPVRFPAATAPVGPPTVRSTSPGPMPVAQRKRVSALERLRGAGSRAVAETAYLFRRLNTATLLGSAAAVIAGVVFITNNIPQGTELDSLRSDLARSKSPGHELAKPAPTGSTLAALPSRTEAPAVVSKVLEEARAAGVELPRGQYEYVPAREGMAARYRMTFPVHATYPQIRQFMDRTLVAMPAVAMEGLRIERKNVGDDSVDAELKLSAYVRSDP